MIQTQRIQIPSSGKKTLTDRPSQFSSSSAGAWLERVNTQWHAQALRLFAIIVLSHWAEHLAQAVQIYILHWPIPEARGVLGVPFPSLIQSEALHYLYALVMLIGLWLLRPGMQGPARAYWNVALAIQCWHHLEHALLQGQALVGHNLFGAPVPMSIAQQWIPRVELHLLYNSLVFIPMVVAMYHHLLPSASIRHEAICTCAAVRARTPHSYAGS
jgi:hypothetical protein